MSRTAVRAALVKYFCTDNLPSVGRLYEAMPYWAGGDNWNVDAFTGGATVCYLHIDDQIDVRKGFQGPTSGLKLVSYRVGLVVLYRWVKDPTPGAGVAEDSYIGAYDTVIDEAVDLIRADRTFGCGSNGPIWQAGEGDGMNSPDIHIASDLPKQATRGGAIHLWSVVEFTVIEAIAS